MKTHFMTALVVVAMTLAGGAVLAQAIGSAFAQVSAALTAVQAK